jgi:hypothetical protein
MLFSSRIILVAALFLFAANNGAYAERAQQKDGKVKMYRIQITIDGNKITGTLEDNPTSREFVSLLPLNLKLEDYSATEKISYLPKKLSSKDAPAGFDPDVGDITYYAPWGNLAIFYKDFGYSEKLIKLGRVTGGIEHLRFSGSKNAQVELAPND